MKQGKVWLVGAGPGDVGLFTLKGKRVLEQAEVVVYDRLVGQGVLGMIPEQAEVINVGKQSGNHTIPQKDINRILLERAQAGKRVVRLKGGDPFVFGRGGEELELLTDEGVPYEIVPGITSAVSVPAYQGIPVTHRKFASSIHIITGHKKKDEKLKVDFEALYKSGGTYIFLMGVSALPFICQGFMDAGMPGDMPAAVLEKGTSAVQRKVTATISCLAEEAVKQHISSPSVIIIGEVSRLSDEFDWYDRLPLAGCRVVVTRPKESISGLADMLREKGAEVIELPTIETVPAVGDEALQFYIEHMRDYQWLVFTSPAGVRIFFEALAEKKYDIRSLYGIKIAVVGPGTERELKKHGMYADCMPKQYDGKELGRSLAAVCRQGASVLLMRGEKGSEELLEELGRGPELRVTDVPLYRTEYSMPAVVPRDLLTGGAYYAVFTSASTVRGFIRGTEGIDVNPIKSICIGRQTEKEALQYGLDTFVAKQATLDALAEAVEECHRKAEGTEGYRQ